MKLVASKFVREIRVQDPDTKGDVELEVHKDPESGALFAIDSSFLDQIKDTVPSPFNKGTRIKLSDPA